MRKNYFSLINFLSWIIELFGRFHFSSFSPPRSRQEPKGRRKTAFLGGRERGEKSVMNGENGLKVYEEKFSSFCCFKEKISFYIFVGWRKFFLFFRWSGENEKLCSLRSERWNASRKAINISFPPLCSGNLFVIFPYYERASGLTENRELWCGPERVRRRKMSMKTLWDGKSWKSLMKTQLHVEETYQFRLKVNHNLVMKTKTDEKTPQVSPSKLLNFHLKSTHKAQSWPNRLPLAAALTGDWALRLSKSHFTFTWMTKSGTFTVWRTLICDSPFWWVISSRTFSSFRSSRTFKLLENFFEQLER